jgi:BASS family bile acid:Na+ symporter
MHGWILEAVRIVAHIAIPLVALVAGLSAVAFTPRELGRDPWLLVRALVAILVVVPLVAVLLVKLLPLEGPVGAGLLIMAISIGPVMALKRASAGGGDQSLALRLDLVLLVLSIPFLPLAAAVVGAMFGRDVSIGMGAVAAVVVPVQLVPLALGVLIARLWPRVAVRLIKPIAMIANVLFAALAVIVIVAAAKPIISVGATGLLATFLLVAAAIVVGHLLGGPRIEPRIVVATFSALRFPALGLLLATKLPNGRRTVPEILAYLVVSALVVTGYFAGAKLLVRRRGGEVGPVIPRAPTPQAA